MIAAQGTSRRPSWPFGAFQALMWVLGGLLIAFILLPVVRLATTSSLGSLTHAAEDAQIRDAIQLSLQDAAFTAAIATVVGVPLAYVLARRRFRGRNFVQAIVDLPLAVPHTVAGIALLFVFGRTGWVGGPASHVGISFYGSQWGIVTAMLFVSAPFAVNSARVALEAIDPNIERAARSLGASPSFSFRRVTLAACGPRHADWGGARLRVVHQRVRRRRDPRLLPGDRSGRGLQPVPAVWSRGSRRQRQCSCCSCLLPPSSFSARSPQDGFSQALTVSAPDSGLLIRGLTTRAGSFELKDIDLEVAADKVLVVLGPSGAGKTMLLHTIAGFRQAAGGAVYLKGRELNRLAPEHRGIGFVFQDAALFPHLSARQNVAFGLRARGESRPDRVQELMTALRRQWSG